MLFYCRKLNIFILESFLFMFLNMHFVYLINVENTDIYKIGFSRKNPELRKDKLKTGNPYKLVVIKTYQSHRAKKVENILHNRLLSKKYTEDAKLSGERSEEHTSEL